MRIFKDLNFDFMGKRKAFYVVSAVILSAGILSLVFKGVDFGLDFKGGTEVVVRFPRVVEINELRSWIAEGDMGSIEIKSFGTDTDYIVRTDQKGVGTSISDRIKDVLAEHFPDQGIELLQENRVDRAFAHGDAGRLVQAVPPFNRILDDDHIDDADNRQQTAGSTGLMTGAGRTTARASSGNASTLFGSPIALTKCSWKRGSIAVSTFSMRRTSSSTWTRASSSARCTAPCSGPTTACVCAAPASGRA